MLLGGSGNQTLVVHRASGVVVLEGALHDFRAEAIIAYVQRAFPGKSITHVVSHHHSAVTAAACGRSLRSARGW